MIKYVYKNKTYTDEELVDEAIQLAADVNNTDLTSEQLEKVWEDEVEIIKNEKEEVIDSFKGDYFFLSNFFEQPLYYDGRFYMNSEAAYQAQKCTTEKCKDKFSKLGARGAKALGRNMDMRSDWEDIKDLIMYNILRIKFSNELSARALLETGEKELIEGNNWNDTYWGVCNGIGKNQLGKTLMQIRKELKNVKK